MVGSGHIGRGGGARRQESLTGIGSFAWMSIVGGEQCRSRSAKTPRSSSATRVGLVTTGGIISHTAIGGLTLGGGLGHLMRKRGLAVDNLRAVDLVTAEGEQRHVDAESEPELFGGLRGGGNFGIVTAFEYRLHPVGSLALCGPTFWPLAEAREVLGFINELAVDAPDELGITVVARLAPRKSSRAQPPGTQAARHHGGRPISVRIGVHSRRAGARTARDHNMS